jgi:hypothetical protein
MENFTQITGFFHKPTEKKGNFTQVQKYLVTDNNLTANQRLVLIYIQGIEPGKPLNVELICKNFGKKSRNFFYRDILPGLIEKGYAKIDIRNNVGKNIYYNYSFADYPKFLEENQPLEIPTVECQIVSDELEITHPDQINKTTVIIRDKKSIVYPKNYESSSESVKIEFEKYIEDTIIKRWEAQKEKDFQMEKVNDDLLTEKELDKKLNQLKM